MQAKYTHKINKCKNKELLVEEARARRSCCGCVLPQLSSLHFPIVHQRDTPMLIPNKWLDFEAKNPTQSLTSLSMSQRIIQVLKIRTSSLQTEPLWEFYAAWPSNYNSENLLRQWKPLIENLMQKFSIRLRESRSTPSSCTCACCQESCSQARTPLAWCR